MRNDLDRNRRISTVDINVDYLEVLILKSGMTETACATELGKSESFFSNVKGRGRMSLSSAKHLCLLLNGDLDRLVITPPIPAEPEPEQDEKKPLYADDKTLSALVETLSRIEKKLDALYADLH